MKTFLQIILFSTILFVSCQKTTTLENSGIIKDFIGLDGCGFVIVLDNGKILTPILYPPNTIPIADKRVAITYRPKLVMSICMVGETIEILSLRYL